MDDPFQSPWTPPRLFRGNRQRGAAVLLLALASASVSAVADGPAKPAPRPAFSCSASVQDDWLGKRNPYAPAFKLHDRLGLPDWLSLSLENRVRYETQSGQFRAGAAGGDQALPLQTCLWLEARVEGFRFGVEFLDAHQSLSDRGSNINGKDPVNNGEINIADFLQGYGAWSTASLGETGVAAEVKLGRQTLDFGSRRLVARNVFRNTINAFTGALFRFRGGDAWQLRLFGVQPVGRYPSGGADLLGGRQQFDEEEYRTYFSGAMLEWFDVAARVNVETYLYYLNESDRPSGATADRELFTPGLRFYRQPAKGDFDFEAETIAQVGQNRPGAAVTDVKNLRRQAWFQHLQAGYTMDLPWSPRFLALYDYASGDSNPNDAKDGRFDTLYGARRGDLGPTGIFGAVARSNINSPGYRLAASPLGNLGGFIGHRLVWLAERRDAWAGTGLQDKAGKSGDFVGHLLEASLRWDATSNLMLETGWAHLAKGRFAKTAPNAPGDGGDVDYFYVQSLLRF